MTIFGHQCLVLIPDGPLLCLRCKRVEHVRRQCKAPPCLQCHRFGHLSDTCVSTYGSRLRSGQSSTEEPQLDHLTDATEVIDASGEAVGGNTENEQLAIEPMPNSHNGAAKGACDDTRE